MAATAAQVLLTDAYLYRVMHNVGLRNNFPFLQSAYRKSQSTATKGGCRCSRKRAAVDYASIRSAVLALPNDDKIRLKKLLNVKQIVLDVRTDGQRKRVRF